MDFYDFPFSCECHHPKWRTHIFQRGRYTTSQICLTSICLQLNFSCLYPIGSMVLVYMLTFGVYWWDPCYHIQHTWSIWVLAFHFPMNSHRFPLEVLVSDLSSALDAVEADSTAEVAGPARFVSQVWAGRIHHDRERIGTKETEQLVISMNLCVIVMKCSIISQECGNLIGNIYMPTGNSH